MADMNMMEETKEEEKEASTPGARGKDSEPKKEAREEAEEKKKGGRVRHRRRGGHLDGAKEHKAELPHHGRKSGGKVPGHKSEPRPDRRARGGATSDLHPETAAGKMSVPAYEAKQARPMNEGKGTDNRGPRSMRGSSRD